MKNLSLTRKLLILFLSVLLITSLFGFLAINNKTNKVVKADSPDYRLLFDYKDYHYEKNNKNYPSSTLKREGTTSSLKYGMTNTYFSISVYNPDILSDTIWLEETGSFPFNTITILIELNNVTNLPEYKNPIFSVSNMKNEVFSEYTLENNFLTCDLENLKDDKYTISCSFDYLIYFDYGSYSSYQNGRLEISSSFYIDTTAPEILFNANNTDNYFNNDKVTVNFFDETSGIERVCYSVSKTKDFPYSANISLENGQTFTEEGNYIVVAYDKAGNKTTKYFTIDKTAPSFDVKNYSYTQKYKLIEEYNLYFSNKDIVYKDTLSWKNYTSSDGIKGQLANSNDALTIKYAIATNGGFYEANLPYELDKDGNYPTLTEEGNYAFSITDRAGNTTTIYYNLDKTPLNLSLKNNSFFPRFLFIVFILIERRKT